MFLYGSPWFQVPRSIVFGQEWQTNAEIPGQPGTSHHCVPKHTCPPISTKNDRDILSRFWGLKCTQHCLECVNIFLACYFGRLQKDCTKLCNGKSLDALVGQTWKFTAHREKHFQCMPSLVVSLDIQAPLKASHKVGDLEEAWYAVRVHKEAGRAHSCKTCKTKIMKKKTQHTHTQSRWSRGGVVRVHK